MLLCMRERSTSDNHNHSSLQIQFSHVHSQKSDDGGPGSGIRISHFLHIFCRIVQFSNGKVMHLDVEKEMMSQCVALVGKFIAVHEPNIRYLGLENMTRMLMVTDVQEIIKRHQAQIITSLKDPDISIRRRALHLLYGMCDVSMRRT